MTTSDEPTTTSRGTEALGPADDINLLGEEVRILWDFLHGDIMDGTTRRLLVENYGMCTRHAWAYATVEIELWHFGAGARGGHQPFDVTVLYRALLEDVIPVLHGRPKRVQRSLKSSGRCVVCADLKGAPTGGIIVTHAGMNLAELTLEANRMSFTAEWLSQTAPEWTRVVCAECARQQSEPAPEEFITCRRHLLDVTPPQPMELEELQSYLRELLQRVHALTDSMTQSGAPATPRVDSSWVEALGWFHGWAFPLTMSSPLE